MDTTLPEASPTPVTSDTSDSTPNMSAPSAATENPTTDSFTMPLRGAPDRMVIALNALPEEKSDITYVPTRWFDWPGCCVFGIVFLFFAGLAVKSPFAWSLLAVFIFVVPYLVFCSALVFGAIMLADYMQWKRRFSVMLVVYLCIAFPLIMPYL